MNILKKHPLPALLLLAVLVLAGYLAFLIPSGYQLQLRDRKADELIAAWPIAPGDKLSLEIEHSFEHIPWYEYYSVTDGLEFNLDAIAVAGYPVDIHHAKGGDCTMHFCDDSYDIPYRCLLPERVAGLLVAGRCSSMNHEAMASTRVMSTCMALGEAAGRAARLALKAGVQPADLDVEALRAELRATGAYLG